MPYVFVAPPPVQILGEIAFWKKQEKEHAEVLIQIIPRLEEPYVKLLEDWAIVFLATEQAAQHLLSTPQAPDTGGPGSPSAEAGLLLHTACDQSAEFIRHLKAMKEASAAVNAFPLAGTTLLHFIRESEYFLAVLAALTPADYGPGMLRMNPPEQAEAAPSPDPAASGESLQGTGSFAVPLWESREAGPVPIGGHTLPPLPYVYNALEPYIDEKTMIIHHDKHHQSYVDGLNKAEKKLAEARLSGDFDLVKHWERELAFNGAGHYLHTIFWNVMSPQGGGRPSGALLDAIERSFGSYEAFKAQFTEAAGKVEGGGWALLVWSPRSRRLEILTAEKHQNLSQWDVIPLLALDVWEHAYYLKHQNNRADYIQDWWRVVNWPYVAERYGAARKLVWEPF
ncbi:Fe-Mn family superoxide dismutase [Paenibacillus sp. FSL H7-0350]|uniref:Fe-Mn family superoxide dismutase n=1 Tax=unclassified Paenibacillus TaxID=185978 RepID=UPI0003E2B320|nr:Fe-Mn family superoxide dismutase [Paenibacillus sp. FSL R7-269]ETT39151.1 Superoxide dismutase [Paenibacillus sp. FSL R7-269]